MNRRLARNSTRFPHVIGVEIFSMLARFLIGKRKEWGEKREQAEGKEKRSKGKKGSSERVTGFHWRDGEASVGVLAGAFTAARRRANEEDKEGGEQRERKEESEYTPHAATTPEKERRERREGDEVG